MTVFAGPRPDAPIEIAPLFSTVPETCMGKPGVSRPLLLEMASHARWNMPHDSHARPWCPALSWLGIPASEKKGATLVEDEQALVDLNRGGAARGVSESPRRCLPSIVLSSGPCVPRAPPSHRPHREDQEDDHRRAEGHESADWDAKQLDNEDNRGCTHHRVPFAFNFLPTSRPTPLVVPMASARRSPAPAPS